MTRGDDCDNVLYHSPPVTIEIPIKVKMKVDFGNNKLLKFSVSVDVCNCGLNREAAAGPVSVIFGLLISIPFAGEQVSEVWVLPSAHIGHASSTPPLQGLSTRL